MPTYQYACTACAERLEAVQRFTDDPLTECPACGGALRKVFSPVGVVFKGSGFYKTDSRGSSSSSAAKPDAAKPSDGASSSDGASKGTEPAAPAASPAPAAPASPGGSAPSSTATPKAATG